MERYRVIDEPRPGRLARFAVDPMWPLLAFMLGGPFFSWTWSLLNSFALNGAAALRERLLAAGGFVTYCAVLFALVALDERGLTGDLDTAYVQLLLTVVSLAFCYGIFALQRDAFEIHEYFEGHVAQPWLALAVAFLAGYQLQGILVKSLLQAVS
jgi:hypothetical protein